MSARAAATALAALGALALEARCPPDLRIGGEAPDLLAAVAAFAAARPAGTRHGREFGGTRHGREFAGTRHWREFDGTLVACALLGALRDAACGGVSGRFALGFLLAAIALRAAFGRARGRGLAGSVVAAAATALVAHAFAGAAAAALGRGALGAVPRDALEVAAATALLAPAIIVPLAALETLLGYRGPKPDLARGTG